MVGDCYYAAHLLLVHKEINRSKDQILRQSPNFLKMGEHIRHEACVCVCVCAVYEGSLGLATPHDLTQRVKACATSFCLS
jgi:hypothetical protein